MDRIDIRPFGQNEADVIGLAPDLHLIGGAELGDGVAEDNFEA